MGATQTSGRSPRPLACRAGYALLFVSTAAALYMSAPAASAGPPSGVDIIKTHFPHLYQLKLQTDYQQLAKISKQGHTSYIGGNPPGTVGPGYVGLEYFEGEYNIHAHMKGLAGQIGSYRDRPVTTAEIAAPLVAVGSAGGAYLVATCDMDFG